MYDIKKTGAPQQNCGVLCLWRRKLVQCLEFLAEKSAKVRFCCLDLTATGKSFVVDIVTVRQEVCQRRFLCESGQVGQLQKFVCVLLSAAVFVAGLFSVMFCSKQMV